jgi:hypothetical protein
MVRMLPDANMLAHHGEMTRRRARPEMDFLRCRDRL